MTTKIAFTNQLISEENTQKLLKKIAYNCMQKHLNLCHLIEKEDLVQVGNIFLMENVEIVVKGGNDDYNILSLLKGKMAQYLQSLYYRSNRSNSIESMQDDGMTTQLQSATVISAEREYLKSFKFLVDNLKEYNLSERQATICKLLVSGLNQTEIAIQMDISKMTISNDIAFIRSLMASTENARRERVINTTKNRVTNVLNLYDDGIKVAHIAERLGVNRKTIQRILKDNDRY